MASMFVRNLSSQTFTPDCIDFEFISSIVVQIITEFKYKLVTDCNYKIITALNYNLITTSNYKLITACNYTIITLDVFLDEEFMFGTVTFFIILSYDPPSVCLVSYVSACLFF